LRAQAAEHLGRDILTCHRDDAVTELLIELRVTGDVPV
jgi:hypothetical protein